MNLWLISGAITGAWFGLNAIVAWRLSARDEPRYAAPVVHLTHHRRIAS